MTAAEQLAVVIAARFPGFDPRKALRIPAFRDAADAAVSALGGVERVADEVASYGGLDGARNMYGVVVARLRWIAEDAQARSAIVSLRPGAPRPASIGTGVVCAPRGVARGAR